MISDNEIIKAFECCTKIEEGGKLELCFECPMFEEDVDECTASLFGKVLDLIKRQQAELDDLKRDSIPRLQDGLNRANKYGLEADKEIERQKQILNSYALQYGTVTDQSKKVKEIKSEAYKEFAEEFEKRCIASGVYPAVTKNILKNLVKELTEGSNENIDCM